MAEGKQASPPPLRSSSSACFLILSPPPAAAAACCSLPAAERISAAAAAAAAVWWWWWGSSRVQKTLPPSLDHRTISHHLPPLPPLLLPLFSPLSSLPPLPTLPRSSWIDVRSVSQESPQDFQLQGSNDGAAWTPIASVQGETGWTIAEDRTFLVPEGPDGAMPPPFSRYRLLARFCCCAAQAAGGGGGGAFPRICTAAFTLLA